MNLVEQEFYHIYNRGNSKQVIFRDRADYDRFQKLLYVMNAVENVTFRFISKENMYHYDRGTQLVYIGSYCLMPNHFHILMTPAIENGIQIFMQKLATGYSMYFNKRYDRVGGLFEGRFKSEHAHSDEYLKYLFAYINLNPLKLIQSDWKEVGLRNVPSGERYLKEYPYSSYCDLVGINRKENSILNVDRFPEYFPGKEEFVKSVTDWMSFTNYVEVRP